MRSSQYSVTVSLDGSPLGVFDKFEGGEGDSEETKYRPGAMGAEESLGGQQTRANFTVGRRYRLDRDHAKFPSIDSKRGKGRVVASKQPLDTDGNPYGKPLVYTGTLKGVTAPDHDSMSDDAAMLELEVTANGDLG